MNTPCPGIRAIRQFVDERDEVGLSPMRSDRDDALSDLGLNRTVALKVVAND